MKKLNFKTDILITIYKSLILSTIITNAITLCSKRKNTQIEIENTQNKVLKIIGISKEDTKYKYNIESAQLLIDKHCTKKLGKIINDPTHEITKRLQ